MKQMLITVLVAALALGAVVGCNESPLQVGTQDLNEGRFEDSQPVGGLDANAVGPAWESNIVSEAFYALSRNRNGTSTKAYHGYAMSDWPYPKSGDCCNALGKVTNYMYPGHPGWRGPLGTWNGFQQGGWCKFFVNLVLYRSSYGYPGGHLVLPHGYTYSNGRSYSDAQPGWIIQSASLPHTAIVVKRTAGGLDVVDCNWVGTSGTNYKYVISRHEFSWSQLAKYGFRAYRAHEACGLLR